MSCNSCNTKFNFFHKEMSCANCGLSFCKRCLKQKWKIPSKGSSECNVCRICHDKLQSKENDSGDSSSNIIVPDTYLKRLENLENPSAPPITIYKDNSELRKLKSGLSPADQLLVDRLEKLKKNEHKSQPPSEEELRKRLTSLKGEKYMPSSDRNWLLETDNKSNEIKADDLLEQFIHERDIELTHNREEEGEAKGIDLSDLDSDEEIEKITKKVKEEIDLDDKAEKLLKRSGSSTKNDEIEENSLDDEQLPWCVLCNEDAKFKCFNCGGDLYCDRCNKKIHNEWDPDHRVVAFTPKTS